MRRTVAVLAMGLAVLVLPETSQASGLDLRLGGFLPRADSNLFHDDNELYTVDKGDWRGLFGGAEFSLGLGSHLELGFHLDGYGRNVHTSYRDFVRESGREIQQTLRLNVVPLGVSLRFLARGEKGTLTPYVAVGPDIVFYEYEEFGDFVDFETLDVREDAFLSRGAAPGFHVAAGLRVPINYDFSVVGEGRYEWAKDDMGDDFRGNRLDLSGAAFTLGVNIRF